MIIVQKAAIKAGNKYLILFRSKKEEIKPDCWDFPGGRLREGEDAEAGLIRQVYEETSLKIKANKRQANYPIDINNLPYYFVVYDASIISGDDVILSSEHTEFRWAALEELRELKLNTFLKYYINDETVFQQTEAGT